MGTRPAILIALPLLLATPSLAQEQGSSDPVFNLPRTSQPPSDPNRQGPELDVFRGTPVTPPASTPVITPPPPVVAQPQPAAPAQSQRPAATAPRPAPAKPTAPAREPESRSPASQPSAPQSPAPQSLAPQSPAPQSPASQSAPAEPAAPQAAPAPAPATPAAEPPLSASANASSWGWIAGSIALLAAIVAAAWLFLRRPPEEEQQPFVEQQESALIPPSPAPAPQPASAKPIPAPTAATADRPWIDLTLEVRSARLSLMGATIGYALTLHNRGERSADDILIRTFMANADANQQAQLQLFFAGAVGLPAHSAVSLTPGQRLSLTGELRLLPDQIAPVQMGDRALLIPLIAFDAQYRWSDEPEGTPVGSGRTGRAFIVGQEKTPPADRLAPFRVDQGPRQFRTPGSRATALELAS
ncbi:hypothetical protein [Sphingobium sp. Cam5-1]|uniref:hypothetical protein n=1 Tax=Sphingobium sp. Cam5-1 TaxID=2789327 RepID=UPI0018AD2947|nr:hypothetical protein [Sphingobium sp. Cam5-1]QPI72398.1 hypothetical protein IZV00_10990 [Sphingobium sp. Cam5-1]